MLRTQRRGAKRRHGCGCEGLMRQRRGTRLTSTIPPPHKLKPKPREAPSPFLEIEMMLRVSPSPAAASANLPAAAGSVARAFVTVATPRPFRTTCRAAAKGKELLSGVVFQLFEELRVSCPLCHRSLPVAHAAQVHRRV
jgi:hypothetical protein